MVDKLRDEMQQTLCLSPTCFDVVKKYLDYAYAVGYDVGRSEATMKRVKNNGRSVVALNEKMERIGPFPTIKQACKKLNIKNVKYVQGHLRNSVNIGTRIGGYYWSYV